MDTLPIINRTYETYKLIVEINDHLEKRRRYSLGQSLENSILSPIEELIMAKNAPKPLKSAYLIKSSSHLEIATLKLRLFLEMKIANETKIFQTQSKFAEIGRMLGGWIKSLNLTHNLSPRNGNQNPNRNSRDYSCSSSPADCHDSN